MILPTRIRCKETLHGNTERAAVPHGPQDPLNDAPVEWAFLRQAENFVGALQGRQSLLAPGEDCLRDVELMEDVFRKVRTS